MKILVMDGQGGKLGALLVEQLLKRWPQIRLIALGTNSTATAAMLRAGAESGATGENPVIYNSGEADLIIGPTGIVLANALLGEVTPAMAVAVGSSKAKKILIPMNKCNHYIVGQQELPMAESVRLAVEAVAVELAVGLR
ncbi:MAG: DUF3842 family protein [Negativicutes bacterium]|nr:DUF3842 family protein [Negativicutes bacterium]